mmetsp:Transcript_36165/g.144570  ORF Transcript_36165/g.144570 Transcript_36165/m.144570 type:complete len:98 (-) Transcript_36165:3050-3343(-)
MLYLGKRLALRTPISSCAFVVPTFSLRKKRQPSCIPDRRVSQHDKQREHGTKPTLVATAVRAFSLPVEAGYRFLVGEVAGKEIVNMLRNADCQKFWA